MSSLLQDVAKTLSFTKHLTPDKQVPTIKDAESAENELIRRERAVQGSFTWIKPEQRDAYKLRWVSPSALEAIGLDPTEAKTKLFEDTFAGQHVFVDEAAGVFPYAQNYAGYQFGNWAGQLGDGRAISLFEITNPETHHRYELQLKGAGMTPYSRFADGKAVLRSSIREALASEAVNALGIPSTRALALVELPKTFARRETTESTAIVTRMAETWIRIGSFDLHKAREDSKELRKLADYCINEVYEGKPVAESSGDKNRYYQFYRMVALRNARMIGLCQAYGFMNGVLNTDNTSIYGLSMDYGPFAFMDTFDFSYTPNHDDHAKRYGYENSPMAIWWNCVRLGESLGELIGQGTNVDDEHFIENGTKLEDRKPVVKLATDLIMALGEEFEATYKEVWVSKLRERLGLLKAEPSDEEDLIKPLLQALNDAEVDYNQFFRRLGSVPFFTGVVADASVFLPKDRGFAPKLSLDGAKSVLDGWLALYAARLEQEKNSDDDARKARMNKVNPKFVLKNWVLQDVIDGAKKGDWKPFYAVAEMALHPFEEEWAVGYEQYLGDAPSDARGFTCSCSS